MKGILSKIHISIYYITAFVFLTIHLFQELAVAEQITISSSHFANTIKADSFRRNGEIFADISAFFEMAAIKCVSDSVTKYLCCENKNEKVCIDAESHFFLLGGTLFQMPCKAIQNNGRFYYPLKSILNIFETFCACTIRVVEQVESYSVVNNNDIFLSQRAKQYIKTIVIDPGHGGKDPGAIGPDGVKEKDIVLAVALKLRDFLNQSRPDIKVYLTRSTDTYVPLMARTAFANEKKADLFISIHANSVAENNKRRKTIEGFKVYFLSQAKNEEDKLVAMQENAVIELDTEITAGKDYLQNILIDLAGNEYLRESQELSILISEAFEASLSGKMKKLHLGVGQANFLVLNGAYMPAVLVEIGFISNPGESKLLQESSFQKKIALALYKAIIDFKKKYEVGI